MIFNNHQSNGFEPLSPSSAVISEGRISNLHSLHGRTQFDNYIKQIVRDADGVRISIRPRPVWVCRGAVTTSTDSVAKCAPVLYRAAVETPSTLIDRSPITSTASSSSSSSSTSTRQYWNWYPLTERRVNSIRPSDRVMPCPLSKPASRSVGRTVVYLRIRSVFLSPARPSVAVPHARPDRIGRPSCLQHERRVASRTDTTDVKSTVAPTIAAAATRRGGGCHRHG